MPAQNLQSRDIVRLSDGRKVPVIIIEIEYLDEPVYVYNFEVEDSHTYYVSEIGVLVHNTGCGGASSAEVEAMEMSSKAGKGGSKYVKASFWERIRTKTAKVGDINPNPLDEFSNPKI